MAKLSLIRLITILVLGAATAAWWKPRPVRDERTGQPVPPRPGPKNAGGRKIAFSAIATAVNQHGDAEEVSASEVAQVLSLATRNQAAGPWFLRFHDYLAEAFRTLRGISESPGVEDPKHIFSGVLLECAHDECVNPECPSVRQRKPQSLTKEGRGTSVTVVTPTGIVHGTHELKRCAECGASYTPNYYATQDPATGKYSKFFFTVGYTMKTHMYIITQRGMYWSLQALNMLHQSKYYGRMSFQGFSAWYNNSVAGLSGTGLCLDKEGNQASKAWYLYRVLCRRVAEHVPMVMPANTGVDDLVEDEVKRRGGRLLHARHQCNHVGCGGRVTAWRMGVKDGRPLGNPESIRPGCYVVDGNCNMQMHVCAAVHCEERPVHSKARFCQRHQAQELQCGYNDGGAFCNRPVLIHPNGRPSKACQLHQKQEQEFKDTGFHRQAQRRRQQDELAETERAAVNGNSKHRFARVYTYCVLTVACGCGVIIAYARCKHGERVQPLLELLHSVVRFNDRSPICVVYDRACQVYRSLLSRAANGTLPAHLLPLTPPTEITRNGRTKWLVDRFHFASHKRSDETCRDHCNPYDPYNQAFGEIVDKVEVERTADFNRSLSEFDIHVGYKYDAQEGNSKVKMRNYVCMERDADGIERTFVYKIKDRFNTQVAEQSYAQIENIGNLMRLMDAWNAEFYFQEIVTAHNHHITRELATAGHRPVPESVFCTPGACMGDQHACELVSQAPPPMPINVVEAVSSSTRGWLPE